jgi:hypothetical protein
MPGPRYVGRPSPYSLEIPGLLVAMPQSATSRPLQLQESRPVVSEAAISSTMPTPRAVELKAAHKDNGALRALDPVRKGKLVVLWITFALETSMDCPLVVMAGEPKDKHSEVLFANRSTDTLRKHIGG